MGFPLPVVDGIKLINAEVMPGQVKRNRIANDIAKSVKQNIFENLLLSEGQK